MEKKKDPNNANEPNISSMLEKIISEHDERKKEHQNFEGKHNEHVDLQNEYVSAHKKNCKKEGRRFLGSIIIACISFIIGCASFFIGYTSLIGVLEIPEDVDIYIGMTPFHVNDKEELIAKYQALLRPINKRLHEAAEAPVGIGDLKRKKKFTLRVAISRNYEEVLNSLRNENDMQMAFVSQALFIRERQKDSTSTHLLGFKKVGDKECYFSYLICRKDKNSVDSLAKEDIMSRLRDPKASLVLGPNASVSAYIIPKIFLKENNIGNALIEEDLGRREIIDNIIKNKDKLIIGALSDEDYKMIPKKEREQLSFFKIDVEIPYDAVMVNTNWWKKLEDKDQDLIQRCMQDTTGNHQDAFILVTPPPTSKYRTFKDVLSAEF